MVRKTLRALAAALALGTLLFVVGTSVDAAHPDIFYNFYAGPSPVRGGVPAQMYVAPRPTPEFVGHTYITYPPMMPHEYLYHHERTYYKYYREGGWVTAHVKYH